MTNEHPFDVRTALDTFLKAHTNFIETLREPFRGEVVEPVQEHTFFEEAEGAERMDEEVPIVEFQPKTATYASPNRQTIGREVAVRRQDTDVRTTAGLGAIINYGETDIVRQQPVYERRDPLIF